MPCCLYCLVSVLPCGPAADDNLPCEADAASLSRPQQSLGGGAGSRSRRRRCTRTSWQPWGSPPWHRTWTSPGRRTPTPSRACTRRRPCSPRATPCTRTTRSPARSAACGCRLRAPTSPCAWCRAVLDALAVGLCPDVAPHLCMGLGMRPHGDDAIAQTALLHWRDTEPIPSGSISSRPAPHPVKLCGSTSQRGNAEGISS